MLTVKHFFPLKIRRVTLLMSVLCCCMTAVAQEFVVPRTNINAKGYPHVLPDNSVEFRIRSNDDLSQMTVSLDPSCRFSKQSDGSWMAPTITGSVWAGWTFPILPARAISVVAE